MATVSQPTNLNHIQSPHVMHIITGLHQGGAESLLWQLIEHNVQLGFEHEVIALRSGGTLLAQMQKQGLRAESLELDHMRDGPRAMRKLARIFRKRRPQIVHTWLYHADILAGLAARATGVPHIVWGIHNERLPPGVPRSTRAIYWACCQLAAVIPDQVVSCSHSGAKNHIGAGYPPERMRVIENGIDTERFRFSLAVRNETRRSWGVPNDAFVVGFPARVSPEKGHLVFLRAIYHLRDRIPNLKVVMCGRDAEAGAAPLAGWLRSFDLESTVHAQGHVTDMPAWYAGVDVVCSASTSEAMPLCLLEAMACERGVVATEVGDVPRVLAGVGRVVSPDDPKALARALCEVYTEATAARYESTQRGRTRIEQDFNLQRCLHAYAQLYRDAMAFR